MKKWLSLILLLVYTISGTGLRELVKVPVLVQHYNEHLQLNQQLTFSQFIVDHYNCIPHTDNDEDRDNQLPFKRVNTNVMFSPVLPASGMQALKKPVAPLAVDEQFPHNDHLLPNDNVSKIWQPPKSGVILIA
ncbi:hypothetical protein MKQ68_11395 [Chitinophaga horti]|uniref:Uncharacterized protein n=1 Tax=Chitinophaga horti TaxID=2920382 RepID=A0ABY6J7Q1_9BACT|nr:hypothetical protein [Chitinophaga horti]UYQ95706.1 hypothetical protein MKQ68_11395 [Chitinophaga horti]